MKRKGMSERAMLIHLQRRIEWERKAGKDPAAFRQTSGRIKTGPIKVPAKPMVTDRRVKGAKVSTAAQSPKSNWEW